MKFHRRNLQLLIGVNKDDKERLRKYLESKAKETKKDGTNYVNAEYVLLGKMEAFFDMGIHYEPIRLGSQSEEECTGGNNYMLGEDDVPDILEVLFASGCQFTMATMKCSGDRKSTILGHLGMSISFFDH